MRGLTVADLPTSPAYGVQLYCAACQEAYSAQRGDYFWMPAGRVFRCRCRRVLTLVRETVVRVPVLISTGTRSTGGRQP